MNRTERPDRGLRRYVAGLAAVAGLAMASEAVLLPVGPVPPAIAAGLFVALVLGKWAPLRFQQRGASQGVTIEESIVIAAVLALPGGAVPVLAGGAALVAHVLQRQQAVKVTFNAAQLAVYAAVATALFHLLGSGERVFDVRTIVAVIVATAVANVVSVVVFAELFHQLSQVPRRDTVSDVWRLYAITWMGNLSAGLLIAILIEVEPAATVLAVTILIGLYLGYRGYAGQIEERRRNETLHEVTRSLVGTDGSASSLGQFLERLRDLFGGEAAELTLAGRGQRMSVRAGDPVAVDTAVPRKGPAAAALRHGTPVQVVSGQGRYADELQQLGHRDGIVAPLRVEGWVIGAVAVYDRHGLEPWDDSDLALLSSLANEAAVALENVELLAEVERERARLAEESQKLSDVVDAASDGIVVVDTDGRLATWNQAMVEITGVPVAEAIGQPWFVVMRLRDREGADVLPDGDGPFQRALTGARQEGALDLQVLRRDGRWRWLRCTAARFEHHDQAAGVVVVARDVTTERETEDLKTDFVATVSHELRTPLTPIRGGFELLRTRRDQMDDSQRDAIETSIERQLDRLETLVGDLLTVADIDRDAVALSREPVDVAGTILQAVLLEAPEGLRDRVDVDLADAPRAIGDRAAVERIVRALLSNGLQHTDGQVRVAAVRRGDVVHVAVSDDGPGLSARDQERIFQRFGRLGDHLHRNQGPGLGLPIARALARRLDGDVTVRSELGRGSTFTVELPSAGPRPTKLSDAV